MMLRCSTAGVAALLLAATLAACGDGLAPGTHDLASARQRWMSLGIDSYDYVKTLNCFCYLGGQPIRIAVRAGVVTYRTLVATGESLPVTPESAGDTIDGLFAIVSDAHVQGAATINVEYAPYFGYPSLVWIDYQVQAADEEMGWRIESFTQLPGSQLNRIR